MLILTRKIGEEIYIGDDIILRIVEIRGTQVRFGITAPKDIPVDRLEVRVRKGLENWARTQMLEETTTA